jgi:hypothetical protein
MPGPALVALAVAGPLAVAALRGVLPYSTTDDPLTVAEKIAAQPGAQSAVLWLSYLALLTLPLGVLIVSRLAVRTRPALGWAAAVVAWIGFGSLWMMTATDQVPLAAPTPAQAAALTDAIAAHPTQSVAALVFVVGHILGTVLLGVAVWGSVPRWAAVALIVSQPLHLVFAVIVPNHALDAAAWVLTAVGFAAAAWAWGKGRVTAGTSCA